MRTTEKERSAGSEHNQMEERTGCASYNKEKVAEISRLISKK